MIGFLMCIPIGPINVWVVNTYIRRGAMQALSIALGGSLMDLAYFYVILSGISLVTFSDDTIFYLKIAGISLIFLMGIKELFSKMQIVEEIKPERSPSKLMAGFIMGVVIYTSNPTLIVTMTGLGAFVKSLELFIFNQINIALVSVGLMLGSFLWFVFLVAVVKRYEATIRDRYLNKFTKISGALMILFSIYMGGSFAGIF